MEKFLAAVGFNGANVRDKTEPNGQLRRCLDVSQAKQLFGFEAAYDLREGINRTVEWFKLHKQDLREVSL